VHLSASQCSLGPTWCSKEAHWVCCSSETERITSHDWRESLRWYVVDGVYHIFFSFKDMSPTYRKPCRLHFEIDRQLRGLRYSDPVNYLCVCEPCECGFCVEPFASTWNSSVSLHEIFYLERVSPILRIFGNSFHFAIVMWWVSPRWCNRGRVR
jgi:hypothetical protein